MELIETLQVQANSIASVGSGYTPEKSPAKHRPSHAKKQGSQIRKKPRPSARTKLAAISEAQ
jgi:hypothetical protein